MSVVNACNYLGFKVKVAVKPKELEDADKIILPGVGNFGNAMEKLIEFKDILKEKTDGGTPFLGICLGIQVILEESEESPDVDGLGFIKGRCMRFPDRLKQKLTKTLNE